MESNIQTLVIRHMKPCMFSAIMKKMGMIPVGVSQTGSGELHLKA